MANIYHTIPCTQVTQTNLDRCCCCEPKI